jgi:hypothetical protein
MRVACAGFLPKLPDTGASALLAALGLAAITGLCGPVPAHAEIYGWVDSSGVVTYSNLPPPNGAKLTDVIHETPVSPQAVADAAHRAEVSALNDRIRLLELEMARAQREVVDYPAPPANPPGLGCGPDGYNDCSAQWGPYYSTGFLYGNRRGLRDSHAYGHGGLNSNHHLPPSSRLTHTASPTHMGSGHAGAR